MDRQQARAVFDAYTERYDAHDSRIAAKIAHTLRVAANAQRLADSLGMGASDRELAWLLGLTHDIGRFEQLRRYGTFIDGDSVDHAELGADILFGDGLIDAFPAEGLPGDWRGLLETAIRLHNRLRLPEDLDRRARTFCELIRDADKVDIFRVIAELPFQSLAGSRADRFIADGEASPEVMACVYGHRCVPREARRTLFDGDISHGCLAFELVFDESRRMALEQGWLRRLLRETDLQGNPRGNARGLEQLRTLKRELEAVWGTEL